MVDAGDLKSPEHCSCRFESGHPHHAHFSLGSAKDFLGYPMTNAAAAKQAEAKGMSAHRVRDPRQPVRIGARLKSGWSDLVLHIVPAHDAPARPAAEALWAPAAGESR